MKKPALNLSGKRWRAYARKPIFGLLAIELPLVVGILVLFGIADPNTYRDRLWLDGFRNGFNSSPSQPIFDLVNGKGMHVPLVWRPSITHYNLVISVIIVFVLLIKAVLVSLKKLPPWFSLVIHAAELALVAFSLHAQTSPDTIDPDRQNHGLPWYITKNCSVARLRANVGYCEQAKGAFYLIVFFVALYSIHILLCLHSIILAPPKKEIDEESFYESKGKYPDEPQWEMVPIPQTPGTAHGSSFPLSPTTPRTRAFNTLESGFNRNAKPPQYSGPPKTGIARFMG